MVLVGSHGDKDDAYEGVVVDFRGNPVDRTKTGGWLAAGLILGTELSERICVMGISMNLVTYLVGDLHISSSKSATIVTNFMGTLNLLGLFAGFLADAKLGRYLTVAIFASITALGVTLLTLATSIPSLKPPPCDDYRKQQHQCIEPNGHQLALLYAALYTIALGGGGIKSNVSGFGSDQFDIKDPKEEKAMVFFFNRFYFCISLGSLFAVTVLVYIQDNVGRGWGYGLSAGTMVIAVIILICGTWLYRFRKPQGSPLTIIWRVLFLAWKKRSQTYPSHPSLLNEYHNAKVSHTLRFRCLDKAAILDEFAATSANRNNPWIVSSVTQVEEVKMVLKLIPIWSTCILFWTIYSQMTTFTIEQATFMKRNIGTFVIPSGSFSVFLFITILTFTSLNERLFVPIARKVTKNDQGITSLQRIGIGLIFSIVAMASAAIIEKQRRISIDMPLDSDVFEVPPGYNAPQQVHITQGDHQGKGVTVSWITPDEPGSNTVLYWTESSNNKSSADGIVFTYKYFNYTSGYIHQCTIDNLEYDTKYYYEVGIGNTTRQFWFVTPPRVGIDAPYTFGLIGDLGQTEDSNRTLTHYELNPMKGQTLLFVGDLSYSDDYPDHDNRRWDTWGRFVERSAAYQPWITAVGNHEIDFAPLIGESEPFKPYTARYPVPYKASESTSPLWYSIKRASAYIIVLSSYSAYGKYTPQYKWLYHELPKVNRTETPWLIVLMHSPLYNSYVHHYMESEPMRVMYESWFVEYKVDVIFSGHVHAYERSERVSNIAYNITNGLCDPISDQSAPVYITIGDGGNQEGLTTEMTEPQPSYSAYREASFGHGIFDIKNRTHAYFSWHRNQDGYAVEADSLWLHNRYWNPTDEEPSLAAF